MCGSQSAHYSKLIIQNHYNNKKVGGLMASWLVCSTPEQMGPGRGHCVVFLGKTLYSHSASLHPGV